MNVVFSEDGLSLTSTCIDTMLDWDLKSGPKKALLKWRSEPCELIINSINTREAVLDEKAPEALLSQHSATNLLIKGRKEVKNMGLYPPYTIPPDNNNDCFSDIEVKSFNMDEAIMRLHHRVLKKENDSEHIKAFLDEFELLLELLPEDFHFLLKAINSSAKSIYNQTPLDQVSALLLYMLLLADQKTKPTVFVRDLLNNMLFEVVKRLQLKTHLDAFENDRATFSELLEKVGDIFCQEKIEELAIACYNGCLEIIPNSRVYFKRGMQLMSKNLLKAQKDLIKASCLDPENAEIKAAFEESVSKIFSDRELSREYVDEGVKEIGDACRIF